MADDGVAWITGASLGIGRALALKLAARGRTVVATARGEEGLAALKADAAGLPGRIETARGDVADSARMRAIVEEAEASLGPVDLAVLNAGIALPVSGDKFDLANFRTVLDVNVMGVAHGLDAVLPRMTARRSGRVALMASIAGYGGLPSAAAYGATKAALINLAAGLRLDLRRHGVTVQVICPGFVDTDLTARNRARMPFMMQTDKAAERILAGLAGNRFEIAFPRRMAYLAKAINMLPYSVYFRLMERARKPRGDKT